MKRLVIIGAFALLFYGASSSRCIAAQESLDGGWAGGISFGGWYPIRIQFKTGSLGTEGTVYPNAYNQPVQPLLRSSYANSQVHFEWQEEDGLITFDGMLKNGVISGEIEQNKQKGKFYLARVANDVDLQTFSRYEGLYQLESGKFVWIGRASELRKQPSFIDSETGRFGTLYPSSETTFFSGATAFIPSPADVKITFEKNSKGETTGLTWQQGSSAPKSARRVKLYEEEEVKFQNGNVTLAGTLVKPLSKGAHPAVVFMHGSSGQTRTYFSSLPYLLASRGIASLVYDKRGSGGSTGDRRASTFTDLADDAIAGINLLKSRKEINSKRIGVWGHSQGGWTAPLAASRSKDVAFIITAAGAAVSVDRQVTDQMVINLRQEGFSEADVQAALAHMNLYLDVRYRREPWAKLEASTQNVRAKPWARYVWKPKSETEVLSDLFEVHDPISVLQQTKAPMLALFGDFDERVPPQINAKLMEEFLKQAGNKDFTIKSFPKADHDFLEAETISDKNLLNRRRYVPDYFDTIIEWILKRVNSPK